MGFGRDALAIRLWLLGHRSGARCALHGGVQMQFAAAIRSSLGSRTPIPDEMFDALYPAPIRERSEMFWTPVSVAVRAAALLAPHPGMRVLDAGAGPGKLCCIGALVSEASWYGVERDPGLVEMARHTAELLDVEARVQFQIGELAAIDWTAYDSLYFFNPFEAAFLEERQAHLVAWTRYVGEVSTVEAKLAELKPGTRVVTYHGFGGEMPACFAQLSSDRIGFGTLDLWEKLSPTALRRARGCSER